MNRIFGLVGYVCNGKTTTLKEITKQLSIDIESFPSISNPSAFMYLTSLIPKNELASALT